jgi:hypothetical protein
LSVTLVAAEPAVTAAGTMELRAFSIRTVPETDSDA